MKTAEETLASIAKYPEDYIMKRKTILMITPEIAIEAMHQFASQAVEARDREIKRLKNDIESQITVSDIADDSDVIQAYGLIVGRLNLILHKAEPSDPMISIRDVEEWFVSISKLRRYGGLIFASDILDKFRQQFLKTNHSKE